MAFVKVQDETAIISCTFFPKQYSVHSAALAEMSIIVVEGTVERRRDTPQVLVQSISKLEKEIDG